MILTYCIVQIFKLLLKSYTTVKFKKLKRNLSDLMCLSRNIMYMYNNEAYNVIIYVAKVENSPFFRCFWLDIFFGCFAQNLKCCYVR